MSHFTRRTFLKRSAFAVATTAFSARSWAQVAGSNSDIRVAVVGLMGRGKEIARDLRSMRGVRVVALCDVDTAVLDREMATAKAAGTSPDAVVDYRTLLTRPDIDAIAIATPNHLHVMQGIWALQAGKDLLHEKPVSHNLWEGRQLLAAANKSGRIVQVNTQNRSSAAIAEAIEWTRGGGLGKITMVRGIVYKRRLSIGKTAGPVAPPATVNYDMFQGPAPLVPLRRVNFHYDWHWQWETGNGDMVAQGQHQLDVGRRFLGDPLQHPKGVYTVGGRVGYEDDGETPNTFIVHYDYPTPFIFEVRGLPAQEDELSRSGAIAGGLGTADKLAASMDKYRGLNVGNVIHCEGGYVTVPASYTLAQAFDTDGKLVKEFKGGGNHHANFIDAVRSRKESDLKGPLNQGHMSCALVHLANISYRTGREMKVGDIRDQIRGASQLAEPFGRLSEHLAANKIDFRKTPMRFGAPLQFDGTTEKFTGENSAAANKYLTREYRSPWVVPQLA